MLALTILVIIAAVVVLLVRRARGPRAVAEGGAGDLRALLQYAFLFAALMVAAIGLSRVGAAALPSDALALQRASDLALGLALTIVGVPTWVLLWRAVSARLRAQAGERATPFWALYVVLAVTTALITCYSQLVIVGHWALDLAAFDGLAVASSVVWGAVWVSHTLLFRSERFSPVSPLRDVAVLAGSLVGLVAFALGVTQLLQAGLTEVYRALAGDAFVGEPVDVLLREGLVVAVLAVPVWWWHWLREGIRLRGTLAHAYLMLVAVPGGLLAALVAAGVALHTLLQWVLDVAETNLAAAHFVRLPAALAPAAVAAAVWAYHRAVFRGRREGRTELDRIYDYAVAGVGLLAAAAGLTFLVVAVLQMVAVVPVGATDPTGRDALALGISLVTVAAPVWWVAWRRVQRGVTGTDAGERASVVRRIYLFLLLAVAGVVAVASLSVILFVVFRDLLQGTLTADVVYDLRAAIGLALTGGGISAYHWIVYRADRAAPAPALATTPRRVLLVSPDGRPLASAVASRTGAHVYPLHRLDTSEIDIDPDRVASAVLASDQEHVLVTIDDDGSISVIPYEG